MKNRYFDKRMIFVLLMALALSAGAKASEREGGLNMKITSPEFQDGKFIPQKFSCQGEGVNPSLLIEGVPKEAKSLSLIVDDPDAPMGTFTHWVVYDIAVIGEIKENSVPGKQGINTAGKKDYVSPCPPFGAHHYFFRIYALDEMLNLNEGISRQELEKAMQGHILDKAELVGLYKKTG